MDHRTIRTDEKEAAILDALREHPSYAKAARKARIARSSLSLWRKDDRDFAARCEAAREEGLGAVEDALMERATKDDTTAAIFLLKTWRPGRYRDTVRNEHTGEDGAAIRIEVVYVRQNDQDRPA